MQLCGRVPLLLLALTVTGSVLIHVSQSLICYDCTRGSGAASMDTCGGKNRTKWKTCKAFEEGIGDTSCKKIYGDAAGVETTETYECDMFREKDHCEYMSAAGVSNHAECYCNTDLCNSAPTKPRPASVAAVLAACLSLITHLLI